MMDLMANPDGGIDVLVLGDHPCTYLAASLLHDKKPLRVLHATIPHDTTPDRVVYINPAIFKLHKLVENARKSMSLTPIHGLVFLGDDEDNRSEHRTAAAIGYGTRLSDARQALRTAAEEVGVPLARPKQIQIKHVDEHGFMIALDGQELNPKALIVGGNLEEEHRRTLGLGDGWDGDILHRYTYAELPASVATPDAAKMLHMSLDLRGTLGWAWMAVVGDTMHIAVEQPANGDRRPPGAETLRFWADVLARHGLISDPTVPTDKLQSIEMPLAGALSQDGVANRTLLIGPPGGFYSACCEDVYPSCWSAVHAVDVLAKALKERHLQDALGNYRNKWRTTLGIYLQGPQQNLRFLLPLVYRNQVMASRMAEAILTGKSVVR